MKVSLFNNKAVPLAFLFVLVDGFFIKAQSQVKLWETNLVIPTYRVLPPDPNPRFFQGRGYQGARGAYYPYAVLDKLTETREDRGYKTVFLENQYVQLSVIPELGGRIFSAMDKGNTYDFFYRQHVIKPALIGMLGAWISGGVEWNVPHHHRATSFMPVDCTTEERPDGSKTIWVGETELRHRMKWLVGITLHPEHSYIELTVLVHNRTPFAQSFLFWINPAVQANDNYQVIFPPDAKFAVQHGKPEFAHWPIAREVYNRIDFTRGVDVSWWKNSPSPVSFFCFHSDEDFFGGYDHGRKAGVVHVANHHVVPGKKLFEWGVGEEGEAWEKILTDNDGPYLELMAGAYSDNQPDYSWIQPGEVKAWKHYWYPVREVGAFKNANRTAAVNLEMTNQTARIAFNTTSEFGQARARLSLGKEILFEKTIDIGPAKPFTAEVKPARAVKYEDLRVSLASANGRELIAYQPTARKDSPLPEPVRPPLPPKDIPSIEELYLTGLRIEQLHSPAFEATPYYEEALKRDPGDYRANTALGLLLCKQWRWSEAEARLNAAIRRATKHYIRPKDGEAFYYLGVTLKAQDKSEAASRAFYKSIWSQAWQAAGYYQLAELDCASGDWVAALEDIDKSLTAGAKNMRTLNLKAAILRRTGEFKAAEETLKQVLALDPLDFRAVNELKLLAAQQERGNTPAGASARFLQHARGEVQACLELASDYANAGLWPEAAGVLENYNQISPGKSELNPMVCYWLAYCMEKAGRGGEAGQLLRQAILMPDAYCFPSRFEDEIVLRWAAKKNPADARAAYYLGNLLFDNQPEAAIAAWEESRRLDDAFAPVHRNLSLGYAQATKDLAKAVASLEKAVKLQSNDPLWYYELDLLYESVGTPVSRRLELLSRNHQAVAQKDEALTREITLLTVSGQHDRALELLTNHHFHSWEGSRELYNVYADALLQRGQENLRNRRLAEALSDFEVALVPPANLEVGRSKHDSKAVEIQYRIGSAYEALGDKTKARSHYEMAIKQAVESPLEIGFYQGLALGKLGSSEKARPVFEQLVQRGKDQLKSSEEIDYFAKFGARKSERVSKAQAHYLIGLGYLGLNQQSEADAEFKEALHLHPAHLGAKQQAVW